MTQAIVKAVGSGAISDKDNLIILFGAEATPELRKVSVIQAIRDKTTPIELALEGKISFDDQVYQVKHIGDYALEQLNSIEHVTLVFKEVPAEDSLANGIYLEPYTLPNISEGTIITYH